MVSRHDNLYNTNSLMSFKRIPTLLSFCYWSLRYLSNSTSPVAVSRPRSGHVTGRGRVCNRVGVYVRAHCAASSVPLPMSKFHHEFESNSGEWHTSPCCIQVKSSNPRFNVLLFHVKVGHERTYDHEGRGK
jgi:hypothetical protein